MKRQNIYLLSLLTIMIISISVMGATNYFLEPNQSILHNRQDSKIQDNIKKLAKLTNPNPLIYKVMSVDVQILYVYDPNSGAPVYKDEYMSIFNRYDLNVTPILRADLDSYMSRNNSFSLIILGPSVGGLKGDAITYSDARQIFSYSTPLLLLGASHGLIDRLENIESSNVTRCTVASINVTDTFVSHQITSKPYFVDLSQSFIKQTEVVDYYNFTNSFIEPILKDNANEIIGGYYHSNLLKKIIWLGFENGSNLSDSGEAFLVNTIIWLSYKSRLSVLVDYIASLQILSNPLLIGYGGFGYTPSPLVSDTYYYVRTLEILNSENEIDINKTVDFLLRCYNSTEGSFVDLETETDSSISRVWSTGLAVYILDALNKTDVINTTKTANFLATAQDTSGGFKDSPYAGSDTINIRNTFAALYGLSILNPTFSLINKTSVKDYILSLQVSDITSQDYGGFKDSSTAYQASVYSTFYAIRSLELLGEKNSADLSAVSTFINNNEQTDGSFTDKIGYTPPKATAVAVWLLFDIGRLDTLDNFTNTLNYIKSMQNPDGGFGLYVGDSFSELRDTYFAILGLSSIGHEPNDVTGLHNFLASTCSIDGGNSKTRLWSSVWTTFDALSILNLTDSLYRINQTALEIYLNSSYRDDKGYFYWTPNRGGLYSPPPELNYLLIPTKGIPMTYFAINAIELANLTDLRNNIVGDVSSTLISSEIVDNTSQFYGMYSYIPYTSTSLINTWNTRYEFIFWAVESLNLLGNLSDIVNPLATREYLNDCYTDASNIYPEARFLYTLPYPYKGSYELATTYFALNILNTLGGINETVLTSARDMVNNNLNYSDIVSIFLAMKIKNILKQYNSTLSDSISLNRTAILELLWRTQLSEGIFKGDLWSGYWLEYTRMALDLIRALHLTMQFDESLFINANVTLYPDKDQYLLGEALNINVTSSINPLQRNESCLLQVYLNNTLLLNQTFHDTVNVTTSFDNSSFLGHNTLIIRISAEGGDIIPYEFTKQITIITELNITSTLEKTYYYNYEFANITVTVNSSLGILVDDAIVTANFSGVVNNSYTLSSIGNGTYTRLIPLLEYERTTYITIYAQKPFAIPDNETLSIFVFNSTTSTSATPNNTELSWGDALELKIKVTNDMELVNGTALILFDGVSLDNSTVVNGNSTYVYIIPNNTPLGQHNITVIFGLYDDPDKYNVSQDYILFNVTLQPNINPRLANDTIYATEEMELTAEITYNNVPVDVWISLEIIDNSTGDIKYNITSYGSSFLLTWNPDSAGNYNIILSVVENETIKSSTVTLSLTVLKVPTSITIDSANDFELSSGIVFNATFLALDHVDSAPILIYSNNTLVNILTVSNSTEIKVSVDNTGVYNITLLYLGNATHTASITTHFVRVIMTPYFEINYTPSEIFTTNITELKVFTVYDGNNITALIDISLVNANYSTIIFTVTNVSTPYDVPLQLYLNGSYLLILTLHGNETVIGSNCTYILTVHAASTILQAKSPSHTFALNEFTVNISLVNDLNVPLTGNVSVYINNTYYNTLYISGIQEITLTLNSSGVYNLTFAYFGNLTYAPSYTQTTIIVEKVPVDIDLIVMNVNNTISINITSIAKGFTVNENISLVAVDPLGKIVLNKTLEFGNHTLTLIPYIVGNYNITLSFDGGNVYSSALLYANITIDELPVISFIYGMIELDNTTYFCGQQINVSILILVHNFSVSQLVLNITSINSNNTLTKMLSVGNTSLLITLSSPGTYNLSLWAVNLTSDEILLDSVILVEKPLPVDISFVNFSRDEYYSEEVINVTIRVNSSLVASLSGTVIIQLNQTFTYIVSFENGYANLYLSLLPAGNYTLTATVSSANYTTTQISTTVTVTRTPTKLICVYNNPSFGDNLVLDIDLLSLYDKPLSGKVINITIIQNGAPPSYLFRETSASGHVSFITPVLENGTITIVISFNGDSFYLPTSKIVQIAISSGSGESTSSSANNDNPSLDSQMLITGVLGLTGATITTVIFVYKKTVKPILKQFNVRK